MSPEYVLVIISVLSNIVVLFSRRIKLIYSPCCYISCVQDEDNEEEYISNGGQSPDGNNQNIIKRVLSKITPRRNKPELKADVNPEGIIRSKPNEIV